MGDIRWGQYREVCIDGTYSCNSQSFRQDINSPTMTRTFLICILSIFHKLFIRKKTGYCDGHRMYQVSVRLRFRHSTESFDDNDNNVYTI